MKEEGDEQLFINKQHHERRSGRMNAVGPGDGWRDIYIVLRKSDNIIGDKCACYCIRNWS